MAIKWVTSSFRRLTSIRTIWLLVLLAAVAAAFWQCSGDKPVAFVTPEAPIEFVDSVYPPDGTVDVPLNSCIRIDFLRLMDVSTMTGKKFKITPGLTYSLAVDSLKAVICAGRAFDRCTEYTVVIDSGIADTAGNVMMTPYSFSFRTESGNRLIATVSPANGQTDVPLDADIVVTFNQGMDIATLIPSNIVVSDGINGAIAYANRRLVLTPNDSLEPDHEYTVTLKAAIADSAGTTLGQDYSWTFETAKPPYPYILSVSPVDGATQVPLGANISITFSQAVNSATITSDKFSLDGGVTCDLIVGVAAVTLNPVGDLQPGTEYTATFNGSITSLSGRTVYINRSWSFTTADTLPPQIVSVIPSDGAIGVSVRTDASIAFNKAIDPASVTAGEFYFEGHASEDDQIGVSGATVTLNAYYYLPTLHQVTAIFDGDVSDKSGHSTHIDTTWAFTTGPAFNLSSSYPASNEGCIPLDAIIRVTFTHTLNSATITSTNFVFEEYNGPGLSGSLFCHDSIVEFQPDAPLSPLKTYKVTLLTGIKETYGEPLPYTRSWLFSAKGENLLPLAIGNKWIYQTGAGIDSIVLVGDTLIMGKLYYFDQHKLIYRCESDTLEFSKYGFPIFGNPHEFVNSDCVNRSSTVTTDNGIFLCQRFQQQFVSGPVVTQQFDFAPGVGLVRFFEDYWSGGSGDPHHVATWVLVSYQVR